MRSDLNICSRVALTDSADGTTVERRVFSACRSCADGRGEWISATDPSVPNRGTNLLTSNKNREPAGHHAFSMSIPHSPRPSTSTRFRPAFDFKPTGRLIQPPPLPYARPRVLGAIELRRGLESRARSRLYLEFCWTDALPRSGNVRLNPERQVAAKADRHQRVPATETKRTLPHVSRN
jgi:hypothetical protein